MMDYRIEKKEAFTVLARSKFFPYDGAKDQVPQFWREHHASALGKTVLGAYGICMDEEMGRNHFEYMIADPCQPDAQPPQGLCVRTVPAFTWAVFPFRGPMPGALQDACEKIYTEWLPSLQNYEFAAGYSVERYDNPMDYPKGTEDENYYCEIWVPVRLK